MEYLDAAKVASKYYRVVLENERVRVLEARMKPKEKSAMYSHPTCLGIFVDAAEVRFTDPEASPMTARLRRARSRGWTRRPTR